MRRKILSIKNVLLICLIFFVFFVLPKQLLAQTITATQDPEIVYVNSKSITITISSDEDFFDTNKRYSIGFWLPAWSLNGNPSDVFEDVKVLDRKTLTRTTRIRGFGLDPSVGLWHYRIWSGRKKDLNSASLIFSGEFKMFPESGPGEIGLYSLYMDAQEFQEDTKTSLYVFNIDSNTDYTIWLVGEKDPLFSGKFDKTSITYDAEKKWYIGTTKINVGKASSQKKDICIAEGLREVYDRYRREGVRCKYPLPISVTVFAPTGTPAPIQNIQPGIPTEIPEALGAPTPTRFLPQCAEWANLEGTPIPTPQLAYIKLYGIKTSNLKCIAVNTAVGEISTDPFDFVKSILSLLLSLTGGIAVILIIISGYRLMTSQGNPEAVQAAREQITSAIVGLVFIIFSLVILEVIGVDILRIPGFEK